ncbi:aminoglycoside phosphotransferase family protein [Primorskyibacter sp. S87]|uniref:aminoglycoside phosphotransferase family protein n=1 Tax=Primorskyibacter sp. S87 TaxID=3415126 RepID=UPI003C7E8502
MLPPDHILTRLGVTDPVALTRTGIARLWTVRTRNGQTAVLKLYGSSGKGNEAAGAAYLRAHSDRGAVKVMAVTPDAVLMAFLEGPSLGDLSRAGRDVEAMQLLARSAARLHAQPVLTVRELMPLDRALDILFTCTPGTDCPPDLWRNLSQAQTLAKQLLATQPEPVPLHGDLHHDNIICTNNGLQIIDAKGYCGDVAFELANALRSPKGAAQTVRNLGRVRACTSRFAHALQVSRQRLAQWGAVKCAHSIAVRASGQLGRDTESDLLSLLLDEAAQ